MRSAGLTRRHPLLCSWLMDPKLMVTLDKVIDDVVDVLVDNGWEDEAQWYDELRDELQRAEPGSPTFSELIVELEQSFLGLGTFTDIPLVPKAQEATAELRKTAAFDTHTQRLGLASCASGIIHEIKKAVY